MYLVKSNTGEVFLKTHSRREATDKAYEVTKRTQKTATVCKLIERKVITFFSYTVGDDTRIDIIEYSKESRMGHKYVAKDTGGDILEETSSRQTALESAQRFTIKHHQASTVECNGRRIIVYFTDSAGNLNYIEY